MYAINRFSESGEDQPPLTGVYAVHNELQRAKRMFEGDFVGPESFASDKDGRYYAVNMQELKLDIVGLYC